jgi:hypothetical protein
MTGRTRCRKAVRYVILLIHLCLLHLNFARYLDSVVDCPTALCSSISHFSNNVCPVLMCGIFSICGRPAEKLNRRFQ